MPMNGLRRNDDPMKRYYWHQEKTFFYKKNIIAEPLYPINPFNPINRGSDYLFLKSPRFQACIKSAQANGFSKPIGGVWPW